MPEPDPEFSLRELCVMRCLRSHAPDPVRTIEYESQLHHCPGKRGLAHQTAKLFSEKVRIFHSTENPLPIDNENQL
jgi:hypothetical protein